MLQDFPPSNLSRVGKPSALGASLRSSFPIFAGDTGSQNGAQPLAYLDSAATAQKHQSVLDAMTLFSQTQYGPVHRGAYRLASAASEAYEAARATVARFVSPHIRAEQVIFTKGTTESLNIVASGFGRQLLGPQDRIVVSVAEHHANLVPWQQAALAANCEIAYIPLVGKKLTDRSADLRLCLDTAEKLITKNTRVVSIASVGNVLGQTNPVAQIVALAKRVGAYVVLDCAQSVSCSAVDYFALGVDAVAFSGHKVYGPNGIGALVLTPELMDRLPPLLFGGGMVSAVTLEESSWQQGPTKFEAGTPAVVEAVGLKAALDWILETGRERIGAHMALLAQRFINGLESIPDIEIYAPRSGHEALCSFRHRLLHAHDLVSVLDTYNICMRAGHHCAWPLMQFLGVDALVRCSFGPYSDVDEVDRALQVIKEAPQFLNLYS